MTKFSPYRAFRVHYIGEEVSYFVHGENASKAKWQVVRRQKRAKGFTTIRANRFPMLDDTAITFSKLELLGYSLKTDSEAVRKAPICTCDLCLEVFYATKGQETLKCP